jgi:hypothetical protein
LAWSQASASADAPLEGSQTSELLDQLMPLADQSLPIDKLPNSYDEHFIQTSRRDSRDNLPGMIDIFKMTPSLIATLRARNELKLYFQALEVFNKTNEYHLGGHNFRLFKTMPDAVLSNIRQLSIT